MRAVLSAVGIASFKAVHGFPIRAGIVSLVEAARVTYSAREETPRTRARILPASLLAHGFRVYRDQGDGNIG